MGCLAMTAATNNEGPTRKAAGVTGTPGATVAAQAPATSLRSGGYANDVPPSGPQGSDWRGGRARPIALWIRNLEFRNSAVRCLAVQEFSGPASGMAGDRVTIWLASVHGSAATRSLRRSVRQVGVVLAQREGKKPAILNKSVT